MSEVQRDVNLSKAFKVLKNGKKLICLSSALMVLLACTYCIVATPIFIAKVIINPPKLSDAGTSFSQVMSGFQSIVAGGGGLVPKTDAEISIAILQTNSVRNAIIKKFNLVKVFNSDDLELARNSLAGKVKFTSNMKSGFVEIEVEDNDPKRASDIANYYTIALGQKINDIAYSRATQRYSFYQAQLKVAIKSLNDSESALRVFTEENGILAGQQAQVIAGISTQLQVQLISAQTQLQSMSYYVSSENPDYKGLQARISSLTKQLDQLNSQNVDDNVTIPAGLAPKLANQYLSLAREFNFREVVYSVMLKQAKAAQLDSQSELSPLAIQVVDEAVVPIHKSKPKRLQIIAGSFFLGLILGVLLVMVKNRKYFIEYKKS